MSPASVKHFLTFILLIIQMGLSDGTVVRRKMTRTAHDANDLCNCCLQDTFTKVCNGTIYTGRWGDDIECPPEEIRKRIGRDCPHPPLFEASVAGNVPMLKRLLAENRTINEQDGWQKTALHYAVEANQMDVVEVLLANGADVDAVEADHASPLNLAIKSGNIRMAALLLAHGANVNIASGWQHSTPLHLAAMDGNLEMVKLLFARARPKLEAKDANGESPLHCAIVGGNVQIVAFLLDKGANASAEILHMNQNQEWEKTTMINFVVTIGNVQMLELLLNHTKSRDVINAKNEEGDSALSNAVYDNKLAMVQLLLVNGANVNATNVKGNTPLHWASDHGSVPVVQLLLLHKANLYAQNDNGQMPIHLAIQQGHRQVVRLLIGTDRTQSQVENGLGESPLQLAAMNGHRGIVMDLLTAGALATPEAVRVATHFGHNDIAKILTDYQGP